MKNKDIILMITIIFIVLSTIIFSEIKHYEKPVPETFLVKVLTPDGNPQEGARCKADIITEDSEVNDKPMEEIKIFDFISPGTFTNLEDKGYYKLETGLTKKDKEFKIKIVCISPRNRGVSYTIINESNENCQVKEGYVLC